MSIFYCEKHDRRWDSDHLEMCPVCENDPVFPNDAYADPVSGPMPATASSVPIEPPMSERERKLVEAMKLVEQVLLKTIRQYDHVIQAVATALGGVCCGGIDVDGPGSTKDVLVGAIEALKAESQIKTGPKDGTHIYAEGWIDAEFDSK